VTVSDVDHPSTLRPEDAPRNLDRSRRLLRPDPVAAVIFAVESIGILWVGLVNGPSPITYPLFAVAVGGFVLAGGIAMHLLWARAAGLVGSLAVAGLLIWTILLAISPPYPSSLSEITPLIAMVLGLVVAAVLLVVGIVRRNPPRPTNRSRP
jgi:Na+/proline symporter